MRFLFKLALLVAFVGGGSYVAIKHVPNLKEKTVEIVDPTTKAKRLSVELENDLATLSQTLASAKTPQEVAYAQLLAQSAQVKIQEIAKVQAKDPGIVRTELANVIENIGESASPTPSPTLTPASFEPSPTPITTKLPLVGEVLCVPTGTNN